MKNTMLALGLLAALCACGGGGSSPSGPSATPAPTPAPTPVALFTKSGSGDNVFDMPTYIKRVRVQAGYGGFASNFIVKIGGSLVVNELMGTGFNEISFEGVYVTTGGVVEITNSNGVSWAFTEVR